MCRSLGSLDMSCAWKWTIALLTITIFFFWMGAFNKYFLSKFLISERNPLLLHPFPLFPLNLRLLYWFTLSPAPTPINKRYNKCTYLFIIWVDQELLNQASKFRSWPHQRILVKLLTTLPHFTPVISFNLPVYVNWK